MNLYSNIRLKGKNRLPLAICALLIVYLVGIVGYNFEFTREYIVALTPANLIFSAFMLSILHGVFSKSQLLIFFIIALMGFVIEAVGVSTGAIFGTYSYGAILGIKLWDTPLIIGLNWLILIYAFYASFPHWQRAWFFPFFGGVLMLAYDFILESFAIKLGLWTWEGTTIPIQNYLAWYLISLVMFFIIRQIKTPINNPMAKYVIAVQLLFFIIVLTI